MDIEHKGIFPRFSRGNNKLPSKFQENSHYWCWFNFLRGNTIYKDVCQNKNQKNDNLIYADFGDIFEPSFEEWWSDQNRGNHLFGESVTEEPHYILKKRSERVTRGIQIIKQTKESNTAGFSFFKKQKTQLPAYGSSVALYPLSSQIAVTELHKILNVLQAVDKNELASKKRNNIEIAFSLSLLGEHKDDDMRKIILNPELTAKYDEEFVQLLNIGRNIRRFVLFGFFPMINIH